jgi:RNA-binding protein
VSQPELTGAQKRFLRGLAHDLEAVVQIGHKGVTESLIKEASAALEAHELIKVKLAQKAPIEVADAGEEVAEATDAALVQVIGRVFVLYRPAEDEEDRKIRLPSKRILTNETD